MIPAALASPLAAMDRRLDPLSSAPVAIALSGGSDSLALLHLTLAWTARVRRPLLALTVDHGLNPESGRWTVQAGEAARRLGASWRGLSWLGPKPSTGIPAAARAARHALLAETARQAGASVVLVGHTADDLAESELIRRETPAHGRMAEWSPSPAWPQGRGVFLLRPLLSVRRADLQSWLVAQGATWLDDAANADPRFARARARLVLSHSPPSLPSCPDVLRASSAPRLAAACWTPGTGSGDTKGGSGAYVDIDAAGGLTLRVEGFLSYPNPADLLAKAILCVAGRSRPPAGTALKRVLDRIGDRGSVTGTLGGAGLQSGEACLRITRELGRRRPPPVELAVGAAIVFDGRFELVAGAPGLRVAPLAGHAAGLSRSDRKALCALPADARPALPVLLAPDAAPRLPAPYGTGPALARPLAAVRLFAALGGIPDERALRATSGVPQADGASPPLILS